jgi:hypothetical protein
MRILGLDPGSKNFAWSVIEVLDPQYSFRKAEYLEQPTVLEFGFMEKSHTFCGSDLITRDLLKDAIGEISDIIERLNVDACAYERFQARPGQPTPGWAERLQWVLGSLYYACPVEIHHVQASAWKKLFLTRYKITSTQTFFGGKFNCEHQGDASLIAAYTWEQKYRQLK